MPIKSQDYECCRCGYSTRKKTSMYRHLYESKRGCQGKVADIELTTEIKDIILRNRRYEIKVTTDRGGGIPSINLNNYVMGLDPVDKLNFTLQHTGKNQIDFEDSLENYLESEL